MDADSDTLINSYERKVKALESEKLLLEERCQKQRKPRHSFEEVFELAFNILANPAKLWDTGKFECRKLVLRLAFSEPLHYVRNEGFRTPKMALPFNLLGDISMIKEGMAERKGFPPPTLQPLTN